MIAFAACRAFAGDKTRATGAPEGYGAVMDTASGTAVLLAVALLAAGPAAPAWGGQAPAMAEAQRSASASGQFVVYGESLSTRGAFCVFAESVREGLANALKLDDQWVYPVVIQIHTKMPVNPPSAYVRGQVMPTQTGFRFQLDVLLEEGFTREAMNGELTRLLLLEHMLQGRPKVVEGEDRQTRLLPHWLHYGARELVRYNQEGTPNELFARVLASRKALRSEEILEGDPTEMDSISRAVFEASAAAFLRTLLGMDAGPQRVTAMLRALPEHAGTQRELLLRYFPDVAKSGASLEKWWALEVATLSQPKALDFLSAEQTQARLQEAVTVRYRLPAEGGGPGEAVVCPLSDCDRFIGLKKENREKVLAVNSLALMRLSQESFPLYRGIIAEYQELVERVIEGKKRGLAQRFAELDERAYLLGQRLRDVEDFMNWYEATQLETKSGAFSDYKKAVDQLRREAPRRDDRISKYLEAIDEKAGKEAREGGQE